MAFAIFLSEIKTKWFGENGSDADNNPNFISWVLVYFMAFSLFSSTGAVNTILQDLGIINQPVLFCSLMNIPGLPCSLESWKGLG